MNIVLRLNQQTCVAIQAYKTKGLNLNPLAPLVRNMVGTDPKHILSGKARLNKGQDVKAVYGKHFEQDSSFRRSGDGGEALPSITAFELLPSACQKDGKKVTQEHAKKECLH